MRFGLILDGGIQPGQPRDKAFKELVESPLGLVA